MSRLSPYPRQKTDANQESAPVTTASSLALEASVVVSSYVWGGGHLEASLALEASGNGKDGSKKASGAGAHPEVLLPCSACDSLASCAPAPASLALVSAPASAPPLLVCSASLPICLPVCAGGKGVYVAGVCVAAPSRVLSRV